MKSRTLLELIAGRYNAQVHVYEASAHETEQMSKHGEPLVDVGGSFSGTVSRPGVTNTVLEVTGDGTGVNLTAQVVGGQLTGATVNSKGTGYTSATVAVIGDGTGATCLSLFGVTNVAIVVSDSGFSVGDVLVQVVSDVADIAPMLRVEEVDGQGQILSVSVVNAGAVLTVTENPTDAWLVNGQPAGFQCTVTWGISAIRVTAPGVGYGVTPVSVQFELASQPRRLMADSPFKQVFDLADYPDADAMARVWSDTVTARCQLAKAEVMARGQTFVGETVVTF